MGLHYYHLLGKLLFLWMEVPKFRYLAQYPTQSEKNVWNSLNSGAIRYHFMSSSIPTRVVLC